MSASRRSSTGARAAPPIPISIGTEPSAEALSVLRAAEKIGYPLGSATFLNRLAASLGRDLRPKRRRPRLGIEYPKAPVYCTNPIAFAAPIDEGPPLLIDQATSATAFVTLRRYAAEGKPLPPGWAIDERGTDTTDPRAALRGALLAFGGPRGANVALMVEVLAAGLTGANWSLDAPPFDRGSRSPGAGLLVVAIAPRLLAPDFPRRLRLQVERLATLGVHIPGRRGQAEAIELPDALVAEIERAGAP